MASSLQRRALLVIALTVALGGCGYVGDPIPPALYIPLPVTDLRAMQEGDVIRLDCTLPARTTEDLPLDEVPEVDLRLAVWENRAWDESAWEREATRLSTPPPENGAVAASGSAAPWAGKRVLLRIRVAGKLGRFSAWSEPVALRVLPLPPALRGFGVSSAPDGARLFWQNPPERVPGMQTEIFRRAGSEETFVRVAAISEEQWIDRGARFGETYTYRIRERLEGEERNYAGKFLEPLTITPLDTFAPSVPMDIAVVAGATGAELSWTRNLETDFREYRVYRSVAGGEFVRMGDGAPTPTFSDTSAPGAVPLRYRITAVDSAGNESNPSNEVEITLP